MAGAQRLRRLGLALVAAGPMLLTACGGGGGDAGTPLSQTYNLDAAITQALAKTTQIGPLTTTYQNVVFNLTMSFAPSTDAVFEGVAQKRNLQTLVMTGGGGTNTSTSSTLYYKTGPYTASGSRDSDGSYTVSVRTGDLPTAATVGASGALSTDTTYADATKAAITATSVTTWSLEADTGSTVLACLNSAVKDLSPPGTSSQKVCFRINAAGEVSGGRITIAGDGVSLEFR